MAHWNQYKSFPRHTQQRNVKARAANGWRHGKAHCRPCLQTKIKTLRLRQNWVWTDLQRRAGQSACCEPQKTLCIRSLLPDIRTKAIYWKTTQEHHLQSQNAIKKTTTNKKFRGSRDCKYTNQITFIRVSIASRSFAKIKQSQQAVKPFSKIHLYWKKQQAQLNDP